MRKTTKNTNISSAASIKQQLDDVVSVLRQRQTQANERKIRAEREAESSKQEFDMLAKALEAFKPLQGFYGVANIAQQQAGSPTAERGHNRKAVAHILSISLDPMTIMQIAQVAYDTGEIKSINGLQGVYGTVATVLSRGKTNVFVNLNGKWDLRSRRRPTEGTISGADIKAVGGIFDRIIREQESRSQVVASTVGEVIRLPKVQS